jgi:hypothetical protein
MGKYRMNIVDFNEKFDLETKKEKKHFTCSNELIRTTLLTCLYRYYDISSISFEVVKRKKDGKKTPLSS